MNAVNLAIFTVDHRLNCPSDAMHQQKRSTHEPLASDMRQTDSSAQGCCTESQLAGCTCQASLAVHAVHEPYTLPDRGQSMSTAAQTNKQGPQCLCTHYSKIRAATLQQQPLPPGCWFCPCALCASVVLQLWLPRPLLPQAQRLAARQVCAQVVPHVINCLDLQ